LNHVFALYVAQPQLIDFALAVRGSSATNAAAMVTIFDSSSKVIFRVAAKPGETRTAGSVLLAPGSYVIQVAGVSLEPLLGPLEYTLFALVTSAPFTANPDDPTLEPEFLCDHPEHEGLYCYPGGIVSADPYLWSDFIDSLDEAPTGPSYSEIISALLGDWWVWVWQELAANGPPLAQDDAVRIGADGDSSASSFALSAPLNVLDNDIDPENETVVALLQSGTQHGAVTLNSDGTFQYAPDEEFVGVDSFTYVAYDLSNESEAATVRISVGFRGDYDGALTVNGADFLAWQRDFGQSITPAGAGADGNGDGQIDAGDLWAWSYNLGNSRTESYSGAVASSIETTTESLQFSDVYSLDAFKLAGASSAGEFTQVTTDLNLRLAALSQPALSATHAATFSSTSDSFDYHVWDLNSLRAEIRAIDRRPLVSPPTDMCHGHVGKLDWFGAESSDAQREIDSIDLAFAGLGDECFAEART
jgi:VCBS repeat-containing protein